MPDQKTLLEQLIKFILPIEKLIDSLRALKWDSDETVILLERADIIAVLNRYMNDEITESYVEMWANAVEGREDVEYEDGYEDIIQSTIFELANPLLTKNLTLETATKLHLRLL